MSVEYQGLTGGLRTANERGSTTVSAVSAYMVTLHQHATLDKLNICCLRSVYGYMYKSYVCPLLLRRTFATSTGNIISVSTTLIMTLDPG